MLAPSSASIRADRQENQEQQLRQVLKSMDELLDIVYVEWAGRYSIICKWPQGDARWPMYQRGEIGDCYDALGWACTDMSDPQSIPVGLDNIENLVLERLASCDNERKGWKSRMADHIIKNRKVRDDRKKIALDQVHDVAESLRHMAGTVKTNKLENIMKEVAAGQT